MKNAVSTFIVTLILFGAFVSAFSIRAAKAVGTNYTRAERRINPPALPITSEFLGTTEHAPMLETNSMNVECKILFHSNRVSDFEIYSMDADGTNPRRLTSSLSDDLYAVWSPTGVKIVFASERDGNLEIYSMDADGTDPQRLTQNMASDWVPDWSCDGKIIFASNRDGNSEIYVMDSEGGSQTRLSVDQNDDRDPVFSPDGSKIAFESSRDGNPEIYVMNVDGTEVTRLTYSRAVDRHPDWLLDKIVFTSDRDGNDEIYLMNSDGSGETRLTFHGASDLDPAFSPDGSKIAFSSDRDGNREIYVMDVDGTNLVRLTASAGDDYRPDWCALERMTNPAEGYIVGTSYRFDFNYLKADPAVSGDVGYKGHRGVDINNLGILNPMDLLTEEEKTAIMGAPVLSPADGKIVYVVNTYTPQSSTTTGMPGRWLWIWHGDLVDLDGKTEMSVSTRFLHLKEIPSWIVSSWQWGEEVDVEKGDLIGFVGDTGAEMVGPHLHFEIWQGGNSDFISNGQMGAIGIGKALYDNRERPYWSLTDTGKQLVAMNPLRFVDYTERARLQISTISDCVDLEVVDPDGFTIGKDIDELSTRSWYSESGFIEDGDVSCDVITIENQKLGDYLVTIIPEPGSLPEESYSLEISTNGAIMGLAEDIQIGDIPAEPYSFFSMAGTTVFIRADGSVDPPDAPVSTADNVTYTLTSNIIGDAGCIVIEKDNMTLDGAGYTVHGPGGGEGFSLTGISNATIKNVTIEWFCQGIALYNSSNCVLSGNKMTYDQVAVYLCWSSCNILSENNIVKNRLDGGFEGVELYESSHNVVSKNNIVDAVNRGIGVNLHPRSSHNFIHENNITNTERGVVLSDQSSWNVISKNSITNDRIDTEEVGIYLWTSSSYNTISENHIIANRLYGIYIAGSSGNSFFHNNIASNGFGIQLSSFSDNNTLSGNNITNNVYGVILWGPTSNNTLSGNNIIANSNGVWLWSSSSNTISGNTITANSGYGVYLQNSYQNALTGNNVNANDDGVRLSYSNGNLLSENNITNNNLGVYLSFSENNTLFHNTFVGNTQQASLGQSWLANVWNDGYPSGGNYWSNYTDFDAFKGVHQNETGSDGVWDHPYVIDGSNQDRYPLTRPFSWFPAGDVDGDHDIDIFDIVRIANVYGVKYPTPRYDRLCDMDLDGDVDIFDIVKAAVNYGASW